MPWKRKGAIERLPKKARGLLLSNRHERRGSRAASIPILGTIPAGQPVDATENVLGYLEVDPRLFGSPPEAMTFSLQVRGDSMIGASIHDGDYAVLQSTESRSPHPNDIVAALIDGEATLKRYLVLEGVALFESGESQVPRSDPGARASAARRLPRPACEASATSLRLENWVEPLGYRIGRSDKRLTAPYSARISRLAPNESVCKLAIY